MRPEHGRVYVYGNLCGKTIRRSKDRDLLYKEKPWHKVKDDSGILEYRNIFLSASCLIPFQILLVKDRTILWKDWINLEIASLFVWNSDHSISNKLQKQNIFSDIQVKILQMQMLPMNAHLAKNSYMLMIICMGGESVAKNHADVSAKFPSSNTKLLWRAEIC